MKLGEGIAYIVGRYCGFDTSGSAFYGLDGEPASQLAEHWLSLPATVEVTSAAGEPSSGPASNSTANWSTHSQTSLPDDQIVNLNPKTYLYEWVLEYT